MFEQEKNLKGNSPGSSKEEPKKDPSPQGKGRPSEDKTSREASSATSEAFKRSLMNLTMGDLVELRTSLDGNIRDFLMVLIKGEIKASAINIEGTDPIGVPPRGPASLTTTKVVSGATGTHSGATMRTNLRKARKAIANAKGNPEALVRAQKSYQDYCLKYQRDPPEFNSEGQLNVAT